LNGKENFVMSEWITTATPNKDKAEVQSVLRRTTSNHRKIDAQPRADHKVYARSRLTNGKDLLPNIDGRSLIARRYRDICSAIAADQGGLDQLSEARIQLIRRYAACCVLAEEMESRLVRGGQIDVAEHAQLTSTMVRVAQRIGLDRVPRDISSPSLADILREGQP
jgi:hypothetical protein